MNPNFENGWNYFLKNTSIFTSEIDSIEWIDKVEKEIKKLEDDINSFDGSKTDVSFLKGDIAEFWHADTYNINSALNKSSNRVQVDRSHDFGSVDISSKDDNYSLKYYNNGIESAKAQSTSIFQRYMEYKAKGGTDTIEEYLKNRNYTELDSILHDPVYSGQIRIIPADQLTEAVDFLEKKIAKESINRPEQVKRYEETLKLLKTKVTDSDGIESIELTKEESEKLARLSKQGKFKAEDYGLSSSELIQYEMMIKDSLTSGINAAMLSMVLKLGPELYKAIDYLIKNGEIDKDQLKKSGFSVVNTGAESFIKGFISSMITLGCRSGKFGEKLKSVNPSIISLATVFAINVIKDSYGVVTGKITRGQLAENMIRDSFVTAAALGGGVLGQTLIKVPVLGYLIGSFVGTLVGTFVFEGSKKVTMSYCIDTGFTLFGIVEQNYVLPDDVVESMGIETFEYEKMDFEKFNPDVFETESFEPEEEKTNDLNIHILRRGVIGVNLVGYIN